MKELRIETKDIPPAVLRKRGNSITFATVIDDVSNREKLASIIKQGRRTL